MKIIFNISNHCNLRCKYCYECKDKKSIILSLQDAKSLIDELIKVKLNKPSKIDYLVNTNESLNHEVKFSFIGGEPTLHMQLINDICEYFYNQCIIYNILDWYNQAFGIILETNGILYNTTEVQKFILKYKDKIHIPISLDGCKECHDKCRVFENGQGSYDIVENSIKKYFQQFNDEPYSKVTFSMDTMKYIKESIENFHKLGYTTVAMSFDSDYIMSKKDFKNFYKELVRMIDFVIDNKIKMNIVPLMINDFDSEEIMGTCGFSGGSLISIDPDGNLYTCEKFDKFVLGDKYLPLGNIKDGITEFQLIDAFRSGGYAVEYVCSECPIKHGCNNKCPAVNIRKYGTPFKDYGTCGESVAFAKAQLYFAKKAKKTDYPYFKEKIDNILKNNSYNSKYDYLYKHVKKGYYF